MLVIKQIWEYAVCLYLKHTVTQGTLSTYIRELETYIYINYEDQDNISIPVLWILNVLAAIKDPSNIGSNITKLEIT